MRTLVVLFGLGALATADGTGGGIVGNLGAPAAAAALSLDGGFGGSVGIARGAAAGT